MGIAQPVKRYTPQEYYVLERAAEYKSDYYDGEIFAMAGGTTQHSVIVANITGELYQQLKGKPCAVHDSNQRLKIQATGLRCYPDVSVYCGPLVYDAEDDQRDTAINPSVLFEVLSPSTQLYDRTLKAQNYRQIPSLRAYVLVSQQEPHVEVYERQGDNSWVLREEVKLAAAVQIASVAVTLKLADVYDRVEFGLDEWLSRPL